MPLKEQAYDASSTNGNILKDLKNGIDYINKNVLVGYSLLKMFIATSALAVVSLLSISYAKEVLMIGERNFGYLVIAAGLGMFVGMAFLGRVSHFFKKSTILMTGFIVSGISLCLVAGVSDIKTLCSLFLSLGCAMFL